VSLLTASALIAGSCGELSAMVVYNNSVNDLNIDFDTGGAQWEDQIELKTGAPQYMTQFTLQYWGTGVWDGDEQIQIRFYANDGSTWDSTPYQMPNSLIFDTGRFDIEKPRTMEPWANRGTLLLGEEYFGGGRYVPEEFTWSVQFFGIENERGEFAGVSLYNPVTVGWNYPDAWIKNGSSWELRLADSVERPLDFAAVALAVVPEPSQYALLFGPLCLMYGIWRRVQQQRKSN